MRQRGTYIVSACRLSDERLMDTRARWEHQARLCLRAHQRTSKSSAQPIAAANSRTPASQSDCVTCKHTPTVYTTAPRARVRTTALCYLQEDVAVVVGLTKAKAASWGASEHTRLCAPKVTRPRRERARAYAIRACAPGIPALCTPQHMQHVSTKFRGARSECRARTRPWSSCTPAASRLMSMRTARWGTLRRTRAAQGWHRAQQVQARCVAHAPINERRDRLNAQRGPHHDQEIARGEVLPHTLPETSRKALSKECDVRLDQATAIAFCTHAHNAR